MVDRAPNNGHAAAGPVPAEHIDMLGGRLTLMARLGPTERDAVLFRTSMAPGQVVPLHSHADPECFHILSGELSVFLQDGQPGWRPLRAGQALLASDGIRHAIRNPGTEPTELMVMTSGRLARFFAQAGRPVPATAAFIPPGPEDLERLRRMVQAYGYWIATAEESATITGIANTQVG